MAVKDNKAFFFTEFKNNNSFYSGEDTIPLNIQYMYNFGVGSQSFIHHLYTNEDIVKEHLIENGITNELSINILLNNEIHQTVTPCILYDGKEFIYSSMLKDYLEGKISKEDIKI